jgi:hypothetical protein
MIRMDLQRLLTRELIGLALEIGAVVSVPLAD